MMESDMKEGLFSMAPAGPGPRGLSLGQVASAVLCILKPEFLGARRAGNGHGPGRTAWLDGLRGWAALVVCFVHLAIYTHKELEMCLGHEVLPGLRSNTPAQWPILRILWSGGHLAVSIFFTVSGYVLTGRMISLLHAGRRDDFVAACHSAMVRRPFRIFLPVAWSTFALAVTWHLTGLPTAWPKHEADVLSELAHWASETARFVFFFRTGPLYTSYNMHTWTIPVELRGSMFLYVFLFALHQTAHRARVLLTLAATLFLVCCTQGAWYACFFAGMLTAEVHVLADAACPVQMPWDGAVRALRRRPVLRDVLLHVLLVVGLYLGSEPSSDFHTAHVVFDGCYGWETLASWIPSSYGGREMSFRWFWLFWAAWAIVVSASAIGWLRRFFACRFSQYLGRHSFALYLVHGPLIGMFSERLFWMAGVWNNGTGTVHSDEDVAKFGHLNNRWVGSPWFPFDGHGYRGMEPNFLFCASASLLVFLYVAEIGTKLFDAPSVTVSNWVYKTLKTL